MRSHAENKEISTPKVSRTREIAGVMLLAFSVFSIVSLYTQTSGWVGIQLRRVLQLFFGQTAVFFGLLAVFLSLQLFRGQKVHWSISRVLGFILVTVSAITCYHFYTVYVGYQLPPSLSEELARINPHRGAGIVGAVLMVGVLTGFGLPGTYIVLGALFLAGILLLFDWSLRETGRLFFTGIYRGIGQLLGSVAQKAAEQKAALQNWSERQRLARLERQEKRRQTQHGDSDQLVETGPAVEPQPEIDVSPQVEAISEPVENLNEKRSEVVTEQSEGVQQLAVSTTSVNIFRQPPTYLLKKGVNRIKKIDQQSQRSLLEKTFESFGISAKVVNICQGPVVTRYELQIAPGTKVSRITGLADDIALALAAADVRIEAPVPGKSVVGIEVPNRETVPVLLRDVIEHPDFAQATSKVALALGKDIAGNPVVADLKKWLHILVAGATGSGKSACLNAIIASLLFRASPEEVKLLLIDPKRVELSVYDGIPHLISPVVTDPKKAATALRWAVAEMERRYKIFSETGVRNIDMYQEMRHNEGFSGEDLPYIVIIVDELADLMMVAASEVEDAICRIAQMARAAGMYLIIATQRPSVDVITGLIKANVPSRIAFAVSSQVDSRTILDMGGAERLIGKGDMLYYPMGSSKPNRAQGAWISDKEVEALARYWKKQGEPEYQEDVVSGKRGETGQDDQEEDELLPDAIKLVVESGQASISMLQRRFRIGYSRAARIIDMMEVRGIVGSYQGSKPRDVLIDRSSLEE